MGFIIFILLLAAIFTTSLAIISHRERLKAEELAEHWMQAAKKRYKKYKKLKKEKNSNNGEKSQTEPVKKSDIFDKKTIDKTIEEIDVNLAHVRAATEALEALKNHILKQSK